MQDKHGTLIDGLNNINRNLPASVYIPFLSNKTRNYAILNIVVQEARLFLTKERAPFMICIEVFRPDELKLPKEKIENLNRKELEELMEEHIEKAKK